MIINTNLHVLTLVLMCVGVGYIHTEGARQADGFERHMNAELRHVSLYAQVDKDSNAYMKRPAELIIRPHARATIVLCHGFMCCKDDMRFLRSLFPEYNTLIFDFRAHGPDKGHQACTFGKNEIFDVISAVQYIKSDPVLRDTPVIGYGFSMGAVSIINAQAHVPGLFDGLVVDCPFESIEGVVDRGVEKLTFRLFGHEFGLPGRDMLRKYAYNKYVHYLLKMALKSVAHVDTSHIDTSIEVVSTESAAKHIRVPAFFIACENDEKTPLEAVKAVYDKSSGFKRLWMSDGRGHFDTFFSQPEEYAYRVNSFITNILDRDFIHKKKEKIVDTRTIKKGE